VWFVGLCDDGGLDAMRTKTPTELLEDLAYESESINVKAKLAIAIAHIQTLEQQRMEMRYRQIAVLNGIKLLASRHYDPEADFGDLSPDDQVAHINARIVWECDMALKELGVN
jgi:hypothetical protein